MFPWFSYVFVHGFSHVFSIRFPDQPSVIQQRGTKRRSIKRLGGHQPMVSGLQVSAKHLTEFFGVLWGYGDIVGKAIWKTWLNSNSMVYGGVISSKIVSNISNYLKMDKWWSKNTWWVKSLIPGWFGDTDVKAGKNGDFPVSHTVDGPAKSCTSRELYERHLWNTVNNGIRMGCLPPINWCRISSIHRMVIVGFDPSYLVAPPTNPKS